MIAQRQMDFMGTYRCSILSIYWSLNCRLLPSLLQNCTKWTLWLSRRMVSLCISNHWRSISRTFSLYGLHRHYLWTTLRALRNVVSPHTATELESTANSCSHWCIQNIYLRWMDLCYFDGWSQLAWYFHDQLSCCYNSMDLGMYCSQSTKSYCDQISKDCCWLVFRYTSTIDIFLHSTQGAQSCRR